MQREFNYMQSGWKILSVLSENAMMSGSGFVWMKYKRNDVRENYGEKKPLLTFQ